MRHYFFDIKNGHRLVDAAGVLCIDDVDAILKAEALALRVGLDAPSFDPRRHIAVIDDTGGEISRIGVPPKGNRTKPLLISN